MAYSRTTQKFTVESTMLDNTTGESIDMSNYLTKIAVKDSYFENSFPLVVLYFRVSESVRNQIRDDDIQFSINVFRYDYDSKLNQETELDETEIATTDTVFRTKLRVFKKPYFTSSTESNVSESVSEDLSDSTTISVPMFNCEIATIPISQMDVNSTVVNQVYYNEKAADVAVNLITENSNFDLYMDYPDNLVSEDNILVPPMNLIPSIKFLQNAYGIYSYGIGIYFGLEGNCYLFSPLKPKISQINTFDIVVERTLENTDDSAYSSVLLDPESNNVKFVMQNTPTFNSLTKVGKDELGTETVFNSYDSSYDLVSRVVVDEDAGDQNKKRYFWNPYGNKFFENSFKVQSEKSRETTAIQLYNIDPTYFTPGTKVNISALNSDFINGEYAITQKAYILSSTDFKHFDSNIILSLVKIN